MSELPVMLSSSSSSCSTSSSSSMSITLFFSSLSISSSFLVTKCLIRSYESLTFCRIETKSSSLSNRSAAFSRYFYLLVASSCSFLKHLQKVVMKGSKTRCTLSNLNLAYFDFKKSPLVLACLYSPFERFLM